MPARRLASAQYAICLTGWPYRFVMPVLRWIHLGRRTVGSKLPYPSGPETTIDERDTREASAELVDRQESSASCDCMPRVDRLDLELLNRCITRTGPTITAPSAAMPRVCDTIIPSLREAIIDSTRPQSVVDVQGAYATASRTRPINDAPVAGRRSSRSSAASLNDPRPMSTGSRLLLRRSLRPVQRAGQWKILRRRSPASGTWSSLAADRTRLYRPITCPVAATGGRLPEPAAGVPNSRLLTAWRRSRRVVRKAQIIGGVRSTGRRWSRVLRRAAAMPPAAR